MNAPAIHYRTCNLCEAMCGLEIETRGEQLHAIRGDRHDPFSRGHLCPKGPALARLHDDPDRLRAPLQRTAKGWRELSWDDALDEAAAGLHRVQRDHGHDALAVYLGNPVVHNHGLVIYGPPFLRALRTRHRYSATSVDQLPQMLVAHLMFGHQLLMPVPDLDRAEHLLIIGANPLVSNGSIMSAPDVRRRLRAIQARGGKIVVLDPRRSETAALADTHHFIRPGTDAVLLLAMLRVLLDEGRDRLGRLAKLVDRLDRVRVAIAAFTPERAARATGIEAPTIRALAHELGERGGVVYGRVGASVQRFGALTHWAINLLNIATGALDRVGGAMFPRPAVDPIALPEGLGVGPGSFGRWRSRVRALPEFGGELPVASLAEDILAGRADPSAPAGTLAPIRGLLSIAGNPVLSTPEGSALGQAIAGLDFMVSLDLYRNETTRHADLILPPSSPLERSHYDLVFHMFAVRNTAKWSPPLFEPGPDTRHDWQILHGLWRRLEQLRGHDSLAKRGLHELLDRLGPDGIIDLGLRAGPYGRRLPRLLGSLPLVGARARGLDLDALAAEPHGVDLGPLEPCLPARLPAHVAKIDLAPAVLLDDLGRLERSFPIEAASARRRDPSRAPRFVLIGRRLLRSNNSWMHNLAKLVAGAPACTLLMHPDDATALALRPGDRVRIASSVGAVEAPLELSDALMPGVVSLPHGFGHGREGTALAVANAHAGVSINDLTETAAIDELSGVAALSGVEVEVELACPSR